ncbi:MAG TPA: 3-dehydroquinate synthase [Acidobacteriaceae bacterium]|nr:3-dehydroquinate synthase [Acidobacteriaceae bacterium]
MSKISVQAASGKYVVHVKPGLLRTLSCKLRKTGVAKGKLFVVTTPEIWALWHERFLASFSSDEDAPTVLFLPSGERYKRLSRVEKLAEELVHAGARRDSLLIAFGGGVTGDLAGFLAAIYMRGIPCVQVPTTYLAQIDSSLGGKMGVNLRVGKNLIGSFHHPAIVIVDPELLSTLPPRELRAGIMESIKAAVLGDAALFTWLEKNADALLRGDLDALTYAIHASIRIKAKIVSADERESGQRMLLNLGHTVGHAIESATEYRVLLHGEAVAWGMIAALRLAVARSVLSEKTADRIERLMLRFGPWPQFKASTERLLDLTAADKKNLSHTRNFILPVRIGKAVVVTDVTTRELRNAIHTMLESVRKIGA